MATCSAPTTPVCGKAKRASPLCWLGCRADIAPVDASRGRGTGGGTRPGESCAAGSARGNALAVLYLAGRRCRPEERADSFAIVERRGDFLERAPGSCWRSRAPSITSGSWSMKNVGSSPSTSRRGDSEWDDAGILHRRPTVRLSALARALLHPKKTCRSQYERGELPAAHLKRA